MYTRHEASLIKQKFWTSFGLYMRPVPNAEGEFVNWINYKTGLKHVFVRMDTGTDFASIALEVANHDDESRRSLFEQLKQLKNIFEDLVGSDWEWKEVNQDNHGREKAVISKSIKGVNVFKETDWPAIISFLKPNLLALDHFWVAIKDGLQ